MPIENSKTQEIKRLNTPLTFKNSKAYDSNGEVVNCIELLSTIRYANEPKKGILTDDEILQYAPDSSAASYVKLKRGKGSLSDVLIVHEPIPWVLGFYYTILLCIAIPISYDGNRMFMFALLILAIVPLIYMYYITNLKNYAKNEIKPQNETVTVPLTKPDISETDLGVESLKTYENDINNLKVLYDVKEKVVRDLIKKRFAPPQITYDKFISIIDSSHKLFYQQLDASQNIINLAAEDTPRIRGELENKIGNMKTIIGQIEDLTNELVINMSSDEESDEVKNLIDNMENLIDSVKEY